MIRASVNLIPEAPINKLIEVAALAEALGYHSCWVYDEGLATRDVWVTLAALALSTQRIRLGPGITNPHTRHPATTATSVATLDELSGGRAFLGVGAGGSLTLDPLGVDRRRPLEAVADLIRACRGLFSGDAVSLQSHSFELRGARLGMPARADLSIWVAGRGPRMLALGGQAADGVMLDFLHKDTLGDQIGRVRHAAFDAGRTVRIAYSTMVVLDEQAMADTKPHMTYRLVDSPPAVKELLGITERDIDRIRSAMAGGLHAAAAHVRDEWVLPFVIAGTPRQCSDELGELFERHQLEEFLLPILHLDHAPALLRGVAGILQPS